ncbi:MAG: sigma-54-dependent Fis family transcriptional regulator [Magnetococcus sp. DMHC-1]|nr:sigma-54-dependent Fis family transcriptional regulator [Magnetococcales bacterium]
MTTIHAPAIPSIDAKTFLSIHPVPTILVDLEYRVLACNKLYEENYGPITGLGKARCYEISHSYSRPCDQEGESCPLHACLETGVSQRLLHVHQTPEGKEYVDVEIRPIHDHDGKIVYYLEILTPVRIASADPAPVGLVGSSPAFQHMLQMIQRVANSKVSVLLLGESGTGKEVVARAIHQASPRTAMPFVPVECSGLTESLFESELFGYERGAFTGAHLRKIGLAEVAHQGTLFLDEIGDIPLPLQVKLLRLLETKSFRRVGGINTHYANFRLICATNRDLAAMVAQGEFRLDLYYRIGVFPIYMPPLRDRRDDLPVLVQSLLNRTEGGQGIHLAPETMEWLMNHPFTGNIRELMNILERAIIMMDGQTMLPEHLPDHGHLFPSSPGHTNAPHLNPDPTSCPDTDQQHVAPPVSFQLQEILPLDQVEMLYLDQVIRQFGSDKALLADKLKVSLRTLYRKIEMMENLKKTSDFQNA